MISLIAGASEENTEKAKDAIFDQIADIQKTGISQQSIDAAKRSLLGEYAFQNETYGGLANTYGFYFAVSDPAFATKYPGCVQSVTNDDIIKAAQKYFDPNHAVVVIVGPDQGGSKQ